VSALYLYAVLRQEPRGALGHGLGDEPLRLVRCGSLVAVAGSVDKAPPIDAASLRGHDRTLRRLADLVDAVLPVRFCTVVEDEVALADLLAPRGAELGEALELVAGREQMTLRLYGERPLTDTEPPRPAAADGGPGTRYLTERLRQERRLDATPEVAALRRALGALVVDERVERHDTPPLLASLYHLVERGTGPRYLAALAAARADLGDLAARPSGPWPPYAFAPGAVA
jgi:Gas vesicle synthesis protein GvpL/GvpF